MTSTGIPVLAGTASTIIFAASVLPMVIKAWQTHDLRSYSRGNLVLANLGNCVHSVYVFDLPRGPIWVLHSFYVVTSAVMLLWSVRYGRAHSRPGPTGASAAPYVALTGVQSAMLHEGTGAILGENGRMVPSRM